MSTHRNREARRLVRLLVGLGTVRLSGLLTGIVAIGFAFTLSVVAALTLSPAQSADSQLGGFDGRLQLSGPLQLGAEPNVADIAHAVLSGGGQNPHVAITASGLQFKEYPDMRRIFFLETDWTNDNKLSSTYTLTSGRYPSAAGEVLVSSSLARLSTADTLSGFGGEARLRVVGIANNDYQRDSTFVLAGTGTWKSWASIPALAQRYPSIKGSAQAYWEGGDPTRALIELQVREGLLSADEADSSLTSSLMTRALLVQQAPSLWLSHFPLILELPLFLVPLLTGLLTGTLNGRWMRRMQVQLDRLGIAPTRTAAALWATTTLTGLIASVGGWLAGLVLGWLARPLVDAMVDHRLGPASWLPSELIIVAAGGLVGLALAVVRLPGAIASWRPRPSGESHLTWWRRGLGLGCGIVFVALALVPHTPSTASTMSAVAIASACLAVPDIVPALLRREPAGVLPLLAVRLLQGRRSRTAVVVTALSAVLALAISATSIAYSLEETYRRQAIDRVPAGVGQVVAQDGQDAVPELVRTGVESGAGVANPTFSYVLDSATLDNPGLAHAITVFENVDSFTKWNGDRPPDDQQRATLERGGVLMMDAQPTVEILSGSDSVTVPSASVIFAPEWAQQVGGVVLGATARAHGWHSTNQTLTYTHLTTTQVQALHTVAERGGFDPSYVIFGYPADVQTLPEKYKAALVILTLLNCLIVAAFTASQGRSCRPYLASLSALGIPRRWLGRVVALQVLLVLGMSLAVATLSAAVGLGAIFVVDHEFFDPVVPWPSLGLIVAFTLMGTAIGLAAGLSRLTTGERAMA